VPLGDERPLELAVVLDDPVEDDRHRAVVAAGQRVRVLERDLPVRRPSGCARRRSSPPERFAPPSASASGGSRPPGCSRAHRPRAARSRGVVPAVLQALSPLIRSGLQALGPTYPMIPHTAPPSIDRRFLKTTPVGNAKSPATAPPLRRGDLAELALYERRNRSTEVFRSFRRFRLGQHPDHGLCAPRAAPECDPRRQAPRSVCRPRVARRHRPRASRRGTFRKACG
jgi:hypothetical protein